MKRLLLDTHTLLWALAEPERLGVQARAELEAGENSIFVSAVNVWEIEIKRSNGKLDAPDNLLDEIDGFGFESLAITLQHAVAAGRLPRLHGDPFDRMLAAQAITEGLILVTADNLLSQYGVPVLAANR